MRDNTVSRTDLDAWRLHTAAAFRLSMLPGDHFFVQSARPLVLACSRRNCCAPVPHSPQPDTSVQQPPSLV